MRFTEASTKFYLICLLVSLALANSPSQAAPEGFQTLNIGDSAPEFRLPGVDDKDYSLADFQDARILMVIFTCNHCPTAQAYEERIKQLHSDYKKKGVALVAITPNDPLAVRLDELGYTDLSDSFEETKIHAKQVGFEFPYLYDGETQQTSLAFGVLATPHVFIFDEQRQLRYKGRIDDSEVKTVTSHDARNALDALIAGQPVPVEMTRVFGCSTKWSDKRDSARESVKKWDQEPVDVAPIDAEKLRVLAQNKTDKYRLFNVWATWCIPCVEELPEFVTINRMYRRRHFELFTISMDEAAEINSVGKVLRQQKVSGQNFVFASDDRDAMFENLDPKSEGAVPYTVLIAPGGEVVYRHHGPIEPARLKRTIADRLGRTYASKR